MQKVPALENLFLSRQGAKFPPQTCLSGTDKVVLKEQLDVPIPDVPDPKDPSQPQQLGAFQFEVRYDEKLVCVELLPGPAASGMICTVQDSTNSGLKGIARMGCVTLGKDVYPDTTTPEGRHLADIVVRPEAEIYSLTRPNQENGITAQLLNQGCQLADLQGYEIPIFSCEDADVTMRYLEGDVTGDCVVDVMDAQQIAFRWGAQSGNALYNTRFDLIPSGRVVGDGNLDINDLQFVFGRLGSSGTNPNGGNGVCTGNPDGSDMWPPQPPVNPKA
jgi:hypothetical protein